jgi:hypothetical protein
VVRSPRGRVGRRCRSSTPTARPLPGPRRACFDRQTAGCPGPLRMTGCARRNSTGVQSILCAVRRRLLAAGPRAPWVCVGLQTLHSGHLPPFARDPHNPGSLPSLQYPRQGSASPRILLSQAGQAAAIRQPTASLTRTAGYADGQGNGARGMTDPPGSAGRCAIKGKPN